MKIPGGFYIKARCIQESWIAHAAPVVRELWDYLLREANHKPKKYNGFVIGRGQLFRTYKEVRDALHWRVGFRKQYYTEAQMKDAMKTLRKQLMITTMKQPRGVLITVCNYDKYQTIKNYEATNNTTHEATNEASQNPQIPPSINKNEKKEKKKTTNPDIKNFIDYAHKTFLEKQNLPLNINGGKDGALIKKLLETYSIQQLKKLWDLFLISEDDFISSTGRSIGIFSTQINKLIEQIKKSRQKPRLAI